MWSQRDFRLSRCAIPRLYVVEHLRVKTFDNPSDVPTQKKRRANFLHADATLGGIRIDAAQAIYVPTRRVGDYASRMDLRKLAEDRQAMTRVTPSYRAITMGLKTDSHRVISAISVLERAKAACMNLKPMACPMSEQELQQRAEIVAHVIRARNKLQLIKDRADALRGDLDRFKARRQAMKE